MPSTGEHDCVLYSTCLQFFSDKEPGNAVVIKLFDVWPLCVGCISPSCRVHPFAT